MYKTNSFVKWTSKDAEGQFSEVGMVKSHKDGTILMTNKYGNETSIPDDEGTFRVTVKPKSWSNIAKVEKPVVTAPKAIERVRKESTGVTKAMQVHTLLNTERPVSRKAAIALVVERVGMSAAGASTYCSAANTTLKLW